MAPIVVSDMFSTPMPVTMPVAVGKTISRSMSMSMSMAMTMPMPTHIRLGTIHAIIDSDGIHFRLEIGNLVLEVRGRKSISERGFLRGLLSTFNIVPPGADGTYDIVAVAHTGSRDAR